MSAGGSGFLAPFCCVGGNSSEHSLDNAVGLIVVVAVVGFAALYVWWRWMTRKARSRPDDEAPA